jgi:hypothetical protein
VYYPREAEGCAGTLTGLAFYLPTGGRGGDPEEGGFYRLVCDYRFGTRSLTLAYREANIGRQPLELERWPLLEQIAPTAGDGWRRLRVDVDVGLIEPYLDDQKLNERPLPAEGWSPISRMSMRPTPASTPGTWGGQHSRRTLRRSHLGHPLSVVARKSGGPHTGPAGPDQLLSGLPFWSAGLAERSTRRSRSGISWFRRSSPSSRSASSSSESRSLGVGQTFGLDLRS